MPLPSSRMNAVIQISYNFFNRRVEAAIKGNSDFACLSRIETTMDIDGEEVPIEIIGIAFVLTGVHLTKHYNDVFFVLEFDIRGTLLIFENPENEPTSRDLTINGNISFRITVVADENSVNRLTLLINVLYENLELSLPLIGFQQALDEIIRPIFDSSFADPTPIPLQDLFCRNMTLIGAPEVTLVRRDTNRAALAIGLEISDGEHVDRNYFRESYNEGFYTEAEDWGLQIEDQLMHLKVNELFDGFDLAAELRGHLPDNMWLRYTEWRRACWSGRCLDWDYMGWKDYVNANYTEHPVWLAAAPLFGYEVDLGIFGSYDIDLPVYYFAWADIGVDESIDQLVLSPNIFEMGARNWMVFLVPSLTFSIDPIPFLSSRIDDFLITRINFSKDHFGVYGIDEAQGIPGIPVIDLPDEVFVKYGTKIVSQSSQGGLLTCFVAVPDGELEGDSVVEAIEVRNRGDGPLWLCFVTIEDDEDQVFTLRSPVTFPHSLGSGRSIEIEVLMTVPPEDDSIHEAVLLIRSNDFDRPLVRLPLGGQRLGAVRIPSHMKCWETPWSFSEVILNEIYERVIESAKEDLLGPIQEDYPIVEGPEPEPPPCPECGYFLDMAIALPSVDVLLEIVGRHGKALNMCGSAGDVYFVSMPLPPAKTARISMKPDVISGRGIIKLILTRIIRLGIFKSEENISNLLSDRRFVYAITKKGIKVINVETPSNPFIISMIDKNGIKDSVIWEGFLYGMTDNSIDIYDINDPYNPTNFHSISVMKSGGFYLHHKQLVVYDEEKLRVYDIEIGARPKWSRELRTKVPIENLLKTRDGFLLKTKKEAYHLTTLEFDDFEHLPKTDFKVMEKMISESYASKESFYRTIALQDEYLFAISPDLGGFSILKKDILPYYFNKDFTKWMELLPKQ